MIRLTIAALTLSLLSACGWQLRGSEGLPDNLQTLHFSATDSDSDLALALVKTLQNYQIKLNDSAEGHYALRLLKESEDKRVASLSIDALANEYELTMKAVYSIRNATGENILPKALATVTRTFEHDPNDALSKSEEERLLKREMQADLIRQIIRQLRFISARQ